MSWFQLDSESVVQRVRDSGRPAKVPNLGESLLRGVIGFTVVSIAGFAPWAVMGNWFYRYIGEAGLYAVCAVVFIGTAGLFMHRLIIGPGSLSRFYTLFAVSFAAYSIAWIVGWMALKGHAGSVVGLLAGTTLMGLMLGRAFDASRETLNVIAVLFVLNTVGYFVGGVFEGAVIGIKGLSISETMQLVVAKSVWGIFYGAGFGAGLGLAFYLCQTKTRALLRSQNES